MSGGAPPMTAETAGPDDAMRAGIAGPSGPAVSTRGRGGAPTGVGRDESSVAPVAPVVLARPDASPASSAPAASAPAAASAAAEAAGGEPAASPAAITTDVADQFAAHLAGRDAMQLIVEVAHDMRSPLGSILFLAERLRSMQSGPLTAMQERQIGLIYSAAFGLSTLAGDVIELARAGEGLLHQQPIPFSVADLMGSVAGIVQPIAEEKGLVVTLIPPPSDARIGQPAVLNRVLLNLTTNALKFTVKGGVEVAATQRSRTRLEFSVHDTGRGIPPSVMDTLFDAFRRRPKPGEYTFSSAGLGLAICQKLVASLGGDLAVDTSDAGTRFHFELDLPIASRM
jgi:signal transduction histidine kinase